MKSHRTSALALLLLTGFAIAGSSPDTSASDSGTPALEVVLVTGERAGPALWKVSSGDHVLWIQGEVGELPERMKWRSIRFERLLGESQELLIDDSDRIPVPNNRRELDAFYSAAKLPRGQTLRDLISPGMYARAKVLQQTFHLPRKFASERPWAAAGSI